MLYVLPQSDKFLHEIHLCELCQSSTGHKFLLRHTLLAMHKALERINKNHINLSFIKRPVLTSLHKFLTYRKMSLYNNIIIPLVQLVLIIGLSEYYNINIVDVRLDCRCLCLHCCLLFLVLVIHLEWMIHKK